jgi:hypothetical protein
MAIVLKKYSLIAQAARGILRFTNEPQTKRVIPRRLIFNICLDFPAELIGGPYGELA